MTADAFRDMIVAYRNGSPVRLRDLGNVIDSVQNDKSAMWTYYNKVGGRSIGLSIQRQPGTNTVEVVQRISELLPTFRTLMPPTVTLDIEQDRSEPILDSVNDVKFTLVLTVGLVVLVIFLFLRNVSATAIPSLALPISMIGTFAAMNLLGYTLDNLSLMALTLSVGFVVDDAIVVLENIVRHMEMGKPRMVAALEGARGDRLHGSLDDAVARRGVHSGAVHERHHGAPVPRIRRDHHGGDSDFRLRLHQPHAHAVQPVPAAAFRRTPQCALPRFGKALDGMRDAYAWMLRGVMRHRPITMLVALGTLVATGYLLVITPKGFIPRQDTGLLNGTIEAGQDISYDAMMALQQRVAAIVAEDPNIDVFGSFMGAGSNQPINQGRFFIRLTPRRERKLTPEQIIEELRPKLAAVPGVRVYLTNPPMVRIGGQQTRALYQFTLQSPDLKALYAASADFEKRMRTVPGLSDVNSDLQISSPMLSVDIDRNRASSLGVTEEQIENALNDAYGQPQISTIYTQVDSYWVILEVKPEYQRDPNGLGLLYLRSTNGSLVPLNAVAKLSSGVGPLTIQHFGELPAVTISFNTAARCGAGRCRRSRAGAGARDFAGFDQHHFPRHRRGVPILAARHGIAAGAGDPGHLYGAGDSV